MYSCTLGVTVLLLCGCLQTISAQYSSSDLAWAWLEGGKSMYEPGVYGVLGVADSANVPGARYGASAWFDTYSQELWLFGGFGCDSVANVGTSIFQFQSQIILLYIFSD